MLTNILSLLVNPACTKPDFQEAPLPLVLSLTHYSKPLPSKLWHTAVMYPLGCLSLLDVDLNATLCCLGHHIQAVLLLPLA